MSNTTLSFSKNPPNPIGLGGMKIRRIWEKF
jgi:hypothetical protein